jgi:cell division protein FtsN
MFPFGDIMLPVIGIVALGLLVVGIKMFFLPSSTDKGYDPVPVPQVVKQNTTEKTETVSASKEIKQSQPPEDMVAVPVSKTSEKGATRVETEDLSDKPLAGNTQNHSSQTVSKPKEPDPAKAPSVTKTSSQTRGESVGHWNVQIGSFVERSSAELEASKAGKKGFNARIITAKVNGKTYHRVYIPAGGTRSDAEALAKKLKTGGFPTFVTQYK